MKQEFLDTDVGVRLRVARERAGLTQAAAAEAIRVARTTLVALEKGQRRFRINEIQELARCYGTSANALLRREAAHIDLTPRFRRLGTVDSGEAAEAARLLTDLVRAEVELEDLLGVTRARNYPPNRPLLPGDVRLQAENDAAELRRWLGLGLAPVGDLADLLDLEIGVRVHVRRLDSCVSGLFAFDDELGACMLLNAGHPRTRRTWTAAHELGHLVSRRHDPDVLEDGVDGNSREERYADAFARAFLTPARTVAHRFREVTAGAPRLTRRHVILLAHAFGVSREALVRRLEELALVKRGTWDWFQANRGITDDQVRQVLGDSRLPDRDRFDAERPVPLRLSLLAAEAHRRDLLSEGQLARLLRVDRVELRKMLDDADVDGSGPDDAPKLP